MTTRSVGTCEAAGLGQQEGAPGHEEEQGRLQQREISQFGEFGQVSRGKLRFKPTGSAPPTTER